MLLSNKNSLLLIVDVQNALIPAIQNADSTIKNIQKLIAAKQQLNIPIIVTEQYPAGLGRTVSTLLDHLSETDVLSKTHFSLAQEPHIMTALELINRRQIVICGMEAHVCVLQSALELKKHHYEVYVVLDAVTSRKQLDYDAALERFRSNGVHVVTTEMVLFEWLEKACTKEFRDLLPFIK
jgi:nicotinamidase-related amidase